METGSFPLLPSVQQPRLALTLAVLGALSFWLPDVAIHVFAGPKFDSPHVRLITVLLPATFLIAYVIARRFAVQRHFKWSGAAMLLGVWLTGGIFMMISATAGGGGFVGPNGVAGTLLVLLLLLFPIYTCIMATYDGSLFALLAATLGPFLIWCVHSSGILLLFHRRPR
jgi:hypothetical protein